VSSTSESVEQETATAARQGIPPRNTTVEKGGKKEEAVLMNDALPFLACRRQRCQ